jgi:murein DD-endopeptidase MepM/ murein hydrolase activator NlpD
MAHPRGSGGRISRRAIIGFPAAALAVASVVALFAAPALGLVGAGATPTAAATSARPTATPSPGSTYAPMLHIPTGATPGATPLPPSKLTGYYWPLDKPHITLPFGPSSWGEMIVDGKLFHDGVDMATDCWDKIRAAHDGVVLTAGRDYVDYMGWQGDTSDFKKLFSAPSWKETLPIVIVTDDGNGYRSIYAHMVKVTVVAGQKIKAGQIIGYEGATGHASGCHLHFGLFSPQERELWEPIQSTVTNLKLPGLITKRIDPLLVLPFRTDVPGLASLLPSGRAPSPSAEATATAKP